MAHVEGLERSDDSGQSWVFSAEGLTASPNPGSDVNAMVFDPRDPERVYAGLRPYVLGIPPGGIFRSLDGGHTWVASDNTDDLYIRRLLVDPQAPDTVYALTRNFALQAAVLKSVDAGQSWEECGVINGPEWILTDLAISPSRPETLYVSARIEISAESELFRSDDGCASWRRIAGDDKRALEYLAVDPVNPGLIYLGAINDGAWLLGGDEGVASDLGIMNISTQGWVSHGENTARAGFIIRGERPLTVLIKGEGPILNSADAIENPQLRVSTLGGELIDTNDNWQERPEAGLIALLAPPTTPDEAALITTLAPGSYIAELAHSDAVDGRGIVAVNDLDVFNAASDRDPVSDAPEGLINISTRGLAGAEYGDLIAGFIIQGTQPVQVLIKAEGPILNRADALPDPALVLTTITGELIESNSSWRQHASAEMVAALAPPAGDSEAAFVVELAPGAYVAHLQGEHGTSGLGLVAVTDVRVFDQ